MLKFNEPTQIGIEYCASMFLLLCSSYMIYGIFEGEQSQSGIYILTFFATLFGIGGVVGLIKTYIRRYEFKKQHPRRRLKNR